MKIYLKNKKTEELFEVDIYKIIKMKDKKDWIVIIEIEGEEK